MESRERLPRPPGGAAAAATGCPARLPMCRAGRLSHSRWRCRAPPAAGELLGEETRQIVSPIFAVEFWLLRAPGCAPKTPAGAPARAARALVRPIQGKPRRVSLAHFGEQNCSRNLTAAPRGLSRRRGSRKGAAAGLPPGQLYERQHTETKWEPTPTARRRREEAPRAPQRWASSPRRKTLVTTTSRPRAP